jgi:hypothetical protein
MGFGFGFLPMPSQWLDRKNSDPYRPLSAFIFQGEYGIRKEP